MIESDKKQNCDPPRWGAPSWQSHAMASADSLLQDTLQWLRSSMRGTLLFRHNLPPAVQLLEDLKHVDELGRVIL
jgi:hypothetical protein